MLKIKDNVDLKELEKYGFHYNLKSNNYNVETDNGGLFVNKNKKIIISPRYYIDIYELDTLYDLIKADLVEKID